MADRRKLQGEIERCLKKVSEGVETFEDIWQKVHNATNTNQKEKYEADLKKEIKKLQRLRDQIKTWITSSEIKDKRILLDNRKLIETQMERFKVVERETKTRAYSKEGLGSVQKLDPAQKEKDEFINWLATSIETLNIQVDQFESEIEALSVALKKKKNDKEKSDRLEELKTWLEKHRYHICQLETLMRMLDNNVIDIHQIKKIKDDVEYYIECSQEPDFEENEFLYDDLELEELKQDFMLKAKSGSDDESSVRSTTPTSTNSSSPIPSPGLINQCSPKSMEDSSSMMRSIEMRSQSISNCSAPSALGNESNNSCESSASSSPPPNYSSHFSIHPMHPSTLYAAAAAAVPNTASTEKVNNFVSSKPVMNCIDSPLLNDSEVNLNNNNNNPNNTNNSNNTINCTASLNASSFCTNLVATDSSVALPEQLPPTNCSPLSSSTSSILSNNLSHAAALSEKVIKPQLSSPAAAASATLYSAAASSLVSRSLADSQPPPPSAVRSNLNHLQTVNCATMNGPSSPKITNQLYNLNISVSAEEAFDSSKPLSDQVDCVSNLENHFSPISSPQMEKNFVRMSEIPTLLGLAPLGAIPFTEENYQQLRYLEGAYKHPPIASDLEKMRRHMTPFVTPKYYPRGLPYLDSFEFFQRQSTETLFFVFYYMEGTKAQYMAAKALKKQSWRFHTRYMMWFQRHEEPMAITDEYEQGTYIYFDYEKWGQRKKEGFTFEYCYLEDRDLN